MAKCIIQLKETVRFSIFREREREREREENVSEARARSIGGEPLRMRIKTDHVQLHT